MRTPLQARLFGAAVLLIAAPGAAEESSDFADVSDPHAPIARPAAENWRSGNLYLGLTGGLATASTEIVPALGELGELGTGGGAKASVGIGLNRYLTLRARGGLAFLPGDPNTCSECAATTFDIGGGLVYHLAQGLAFDPWIGLGMAYRTTNLTFTAISDPASEPVTSTFSGFDIARISIGGDFYPTPAFGFGPVLETDVGLRRSNNRTVSYALFHAGIRVIFDPFRAGTTYDPLSTAALAP